MDLNNCGMNCVIYCILVYSDKTMMSTNKPLAAFSEHNDIKDIIRKQLTNYVYITNPVQSNVIEVGIKLFAHWTF